MASNSLKSWAYNSIKFSSTGASSEVAGTRSTVALPSWAWNVICQTPKLHPEGAAESPARIVRLRTVVVHEDAAEAAIAKNGATELSNLGRRFHPARRFRIEISKRLKFSLLFFRQQLDSDRSCHVDSAVFRLSFFPGLQRFPVIAKTPAAFRAFRGTIVKDVFAGLSVKANNIWFAAGAFHFIARPQFFRSGFQLGF